MSDVIFSWIMTSWLVTCWEVLGCRVDIKCLCLKLQAALLIAQKNNVNKLCKHIGHHPWAVNYNLQIPRCLIISTVQSELAEMSKMNWQNFASSFYRLTQCGRWIYSQHLLYITSRWRYSKKDIISNKGFWYSSAYLKTGFVSAFFSAHSWCP